MEAVTLTLSAYAFLANSALVTIGTVTEVTLTVFFAVCSMVAMGTAVEGYCFRKLDPVTRVLFLAASMGLVLPCVQWKLASLDPGVVMTVLAWYRARPSVAVAVLG